MGRDFKLRPTVNGANVLLAGDTVTADTELGPALTLADALSNPSVTTVGSYLLGFNGTTWDRVRTANTGRLQVDVVTGGGGGTQYVEDVALGAAGTVTLAGARASTATPAAMSADGDAVALWATRNGAMVIDGGIAEDAVYTGNPIVLGGRASSATPTAVSADGDVVPIWVTRSGSLVATGSFIDNQVFTDGTSRVSPMGFYFDEVAGTALTENDVAAARIDSKRAQINVIEDATTRGTRSAVAAPGDAAAALNGLATISQLHGYNGTTWDRVRVANTGRLQVDVVTGGGGGTQYTEDAALGANGTGTLMLARRDTALSTLTPVDDDAVGLRVDNFGALWVRPSVGAVIQIAGDDGAPMSPVITLADNMPATGGALPAVSYTSYFDGTSWDRGRTTDGFVTASATPTVGIQAAMAPDRRYSAQTLGATVGNTQSWDVMGADTMLVQVVTTRTGTFTFEVSADGTNYKPAEVRDVEVDNWQTGGYANITPTANKVYRVVTNGWRTMRARTVTTLSGTTDLIATLAAHSTVINAIDTGPAPHSIGYALTSKTAQYTTTQTGAALWTPASGKKLVITSYQIQAGGTTAGAVQIWFGASGDTTYSRATDLAIFDGEFAPSATLKPGVVQTGCWIASAADHILRVTDSAAINPLTVTVWGYEI